jgi:hypothetical protein
MCYCQFLFTALELFHLNVLSWTCTARKLDLVHIYGQISACLFTAKLKTDPQPNYDFKNLVSFVFTRNARLLPFDGQAPIITVLRRVKPVWRPVLKRWERQPFYWPTDISGFNSKSWSERHGRMVRIPASYSGGPGFKSRPGDRLSWVRTFVVLRRPSRQIPGEYLKLSHDHFLPHPFQFIIH